uniref:Uncharacterized protein n=1 Tax=Salix viminalis TaxID=40686 RepID=A0A6N2KXC7_SALVM
MSLYCGPTSSRRFLFCCLYFLPYSWVWKGYCYCCFLLMEGKVLLVMGLVMQLV